MYHAYRFVHIAGSLLGLEEFLSNSSLFELEKVIKSHFGLNLYIAFLPREELRVVYMTGEIGDRILWGIIVESGHDFDRDRSQHLRNIVNTGRVKTFGIEIPPSLKKR